MITVSIYVKPEALLKNSIQLVGMSSPNDYHTILINVPIENIVRVDNGFERSIITFKTGL